MLRVRDEGREILRFPASEFKKYRCVIASLREACQNIKTNNI